MKNAVNRDIPDELLQNGYEVFRGTNHRDAASYKKASPRSALRTSQQDTKVLPSIREAIKAVGFRDGMTVSFHHHFREGDYIVNQVMKEIVDLGYRDITIAASSLGQAHDPVAEYIEQGIVTIAGRPLRLEVPVPAGPVRLSELLR